MIRTTLAVAFCAALLASVGAGGEQPPKTPATGEKTPATWAGAAEEGETDAQAVESTGAEATEDAGEQLAEFPYQWVEVADGVYAALQRPTIRFNDSNSVVIVAESDVVVVDTQNFPKTNRLLIGKIRQVTGKPVRYLVNTHWHGDHTQGNEVYKRAFPELEIIGHPTHAEDIPGRAAPQLEEQIEFYREALPRAQDRLDRGVDRSGEPLDATGKEFLARQIADAGAILGQMQAVEFVGPDVTVDDRLVLESGERRIEIRHYRGHTRGDLVVFLPDEKILVSGDLLDDLPYGGHGYPKEWVATLDELAALDFETVITGHGRIHQGKGHLRKVREMFATIVAAAERASRAGTGLEELTASLDLEEYRQAFAGDDPMGNQAFDRFVPATIERAWLEARGELED